MSGLDWRKPADAMPAEGAQVLVALHNETIGHDVVEMRQRPGSDVVLWVGSYQHYFTPEIAHWATFPEAPE